MATLSNLFATYMSALELPVESGGLGISAILGHPDLGRPPAELPVAALVFVSDTYSRGGQDALNVRQQRMGSTTTEIRASLYIFADNERSLLAAIDNLRMVKATLLSLTIPGSPLASVYAIRYDASNREPFTGESRMLDHAVATEIVFVNR